MLALVLLLATQTAPSFSECVLQRGEVAAATVEHAGRTYSLRNAACKELFLSDPERYSQLYDALAEMAAEGAAPPRKSEDSLVPS